MLPAELATELEENRASTKGSVECQRERLWRALLRRKEPGVDVSWFECDNAGSKTLGQMIGVESDSEASSVPESRRKSETAARTREVEEQSRERSE